MRAILIASGYLPEMEPLVSYRPTPLFNIADKPIIFHIIEALILQGIEEFHLVTHHLPEQIEERLEEGSRWGATIHYHLAKDPLYPFNCLIPMLSNWKDNSVLVGLGDSLPMLPNLKQVQKTPILFNEPSEKWSGWGILPTEFLLNLSSSTTAENIPTLLNTSSVVQVSEHFSVRGYKELKRSNQLFMNKDSFKGIFPTTAKKVEPGIWISRAVILEPGVEVFPPIFIGENTHIKSGARIGPYTMIENHCLIDANSTIVDSIICQNSYVGEALEISDCVIDRNCLVNMKLETHLEIKEDFIISESTPPSFFASFLHLLERGTAILLFTAFFPVYLFKRITSSIDLKEVVLIPSKQTFKLSSFESGFFQRLPWLLHIIKGQIHFVGVRPRTSQEINALPPDWKILYLRSKIGIITLLDVDHGEAPSPDDQYAAETYYAVHQGKWYDCKLLLRWFLKKLGWRSYG